MTGAAATAIAVALVSGSSGGAAGQSVDYGVRIIAPVNAAGKPIRARTTVGVPFRLEVELSTTRAAEIASLTYDMFLPTDVTIPLDPVRMRDGRQTSRCLRVCNVGWDTTRSLVSPVFYVLVPPKPGSFMVAVHIVSTDRADPRAGNNSATLIIPVAAPHLTLGVPKLTAGPPRAGQVFTASVAVWRSGAPVTPTSAQCRAAIGTRRLEGTAARRHGALSCSWSIPGATGGRTLETRVTAAVGSLTVTRSWVYAIGR